MRNVVTYVLGAVIVVAGVRHAAATGVEMLLKWQTPDGRVYFGQAPPRGSIPIGTVGDIGHVSGAPAPVAEEIPPPAETEIARQATQAVALKSAPRKPTASPRGLPVDFVGQAATTVRRDRREVTFCVKNYTDKDRAVTVRRGEAIYAVGVVGANSVRCATKDTAELGAEMVVIGADEKPALGDR
jgi:hypothetical protein